MPASPTVFKGPDVTLCLQPETCRSSTDAAAGQAEAELPQHTHRTPWDHQTHLPALSPMPPALLCASRSTPCQPVNQTQ